MSKEHTPFRYDHVGSFLRPAKLKQARLDFQAGMIDAAALKAVEDEAIVDLVHKQQKAGYHAIIDGEFRRPRGIWTLCGASSPFTYRRFRGKFAPCYRLKLTRVFQSGKPFTL